MVQRLGIRAFGAFFLLAPVVSCDTVAVTSVAVASVNVMPASLDLVTGQTTQLSVSAFDGTGSQLSTTNVQWTATPADIVQVDATGKITALAPGTATISAATGGVVGNSVASVGVPGLLALSASELGFDGIEGEASPSAQALQIGVGDEGRVMGLSTNIVYSPGANGWLTAELNSDRAPAALTVRANTGALPEGTYQARIEVLSNSATNSPMEVRVLFTVAEALPVIQLNPASLSFQGSETKAAQITNVGAGILDGLTAVAEYDANQPTGWLSLALSQTTGPATLVATTDDLSLPPGTHTARIVLTSANPKVTAVTMPVTLQGGQQAPRLRATPESVSLSANAGAAATLAVDVTNAGTGSLTGLRKAVGYAAGQPTGWLVTTLSATTAPAVLSLVASTTGLPFGQYSASIELIGNAPNSPIFIPVSLTVTTVPAQAPAAPSGLTAGVGATGNTAALAWTDNSSNETSFELRRRAKGGLWTSIASTAADVQVYTDTGLAAGTTYEYGVRACNSVGCSGWSKGATVTLPAPVVIPAAPSKLTASGNAGIVTLGWSDNSVNETHFEVQRRGQTGPWTALASAPQDAQALLDPGVTAGGTYRYRLRACNTVGCSSWSNEAVVTVPVPVAIPAAPTGLQGTAAGLVVTLGWSDNSTNETSFEIRRVAVGATWQIIGTAGTDTVSYVDATVAAGTAYDYQVRSCNSAGCSPWSNRLTVTVPAPTQQPAVPGNPVLTVLSAIDIDVAWADNSGNETRFDIQRRTSITAWSIIASPAANVVTYRDTGLLPGFEYRYRIRACNASGCSAWTSVIRATTPSPTAAPKSPSAPTFVSASPQQVVMTWTDLSDNETFFVIEEGSLTTSWLAIGLVGVNVTTFTDTKVITGQQIFYRVRACNTAGCSGAFSASITIP